MAERGEKGGERKGRGRGRERERERELVRPSIYIFELTTTQHHHLIVSPHISLQTIKYTP